MWKNWRKDKWHSIIPNCTVEILLEWDNLWKSQGGSQVNLCPRAGFWPRVWPRMWPRVCLRKIPRACNLPRGVDWVLKGPPEGTDSSGYPRRLFHRLSFFLNSAIVEWDWTIVRLFNLPLGSRLSFCLFVQSSPREKRGESYPREFIRLSQLNPNQLWRELERMYIECRKFSRQPLQLFQGVLFDWSCKKF